MITLFVLGFVLGTCVGLGLAWGLLIGGDAAGIDDEEADY